MQGNGILWQCWIVFFLILHCKDLFVRAGCRMQEDKCGPVCKLNPITEELECNLRAVLIFTNSTLFEASLPKVGSKDQMFGNLINFRFNSLFCVQSLGKVHYLLFFSNL